MHMTRRQRAVATKARRDFKNSDTSLPPLKPVNGRDAVEQEALRRAASRRPGWWAR